MRDHGIGGGAVAAECDVKEEADAAFDLARLAGADKSVTQQAADRHQPLAQAAGGARDWKATNRGAVTARVAPRLCSMRSKPTGSGSVGGVETNEFEMRKIEAQIAQ